jgi:hypothetical protein
VPWPCITEFALAAVRPRIDAYLQRAHPPPRTTLPPLELQEAR